MKTRSCSLILLLTITTALFAQDLNTYKAIYDKRMGDIAVEHGATISQLNESYSKALNTLSERATSAGDLDKMQSVMAEMKRFEAEKTVPEEARQDNSDIRDVQQSYLQSYKSMELAKAKKLLSLSSKYDSALGELQVSLAKQKRIDEAVAVKSERDAVAKTEELIAAQKAVSAAVVNNKATSNSVITRKAADPKARKVLNSALTKDLLLHYTFDDFRGSKVSDESGQRNHGSVTGAPKKVMGVRGSAIAVDGKKDMIVVQARKAELTNVHESDYTLALWFKPLSKPDIERRNGPSGLLMKAGTDVGLYYTQEQSFAMVNWLFTKAKDPGSNTYVDTRTAPTVLENEWVYVVATLNKKDKAIKLYIDGELEKERVWEYDWSPAPNGSPWRIGMAHVGRCMTHGVFDEIRIYSRTLASDEILKLYESTAPKQ